MKTKYKLLYQTSIASLRPVRLACLAPAMMLLTSHMQAAVVFTDNFESPVIANPTGYSLVNTTQLVDTNKWVQSAEGFASSRRGLVHESENGGNTFTDPTGSQAWAGRYDSNTSLTSAFNQIGSIAVGQTITVTFSAVRDGYVSNLTTGTGGTATNSNNTNGTSLDAYLVLFDGASTRNDGRTFNSNTTAILASLTGAQGVNDTYQTFQFSYTVGNNVIDNNGVAAGVATAWDPALLGQDIAVRFGEGNHAIIDNVSVSIIPEPSTALLGGLGLLALVRRRR